MRYYNGVRHPVPFPCPANVRRIDMGAYPLVDSMHANGVLLDLDILKVVSTECSELMLLKEKEIIEHVGKAHTVNPSSPKQVAELLWVKLRVQGDREVPRTDSGGLSTDASTLKLYKDIHPVVATILDWRQYQKIQGTYADKLPRMVSDKGRIHTRFKPTDTTTGRYASEDPNLQNIPSRSDLGKRIRSAFIPVPGWKLVGRDLSQIEMRITAHLSQEPSMLAGYHTPGWDMHTQTAMDIFGLTIDQVDKHKHRLPAKTCGFGVVYLIGAQGLQGAIAVAGGGFWPESECQALLDRFYEARPYIRAAQEAQFARARRYGMVWTECGRHRIIPQVRSALKWVEGAGLREGANQPTQGLAGDILKISMAEQWDLLKHFNRGDERVRVLLQVHDEVIYEAREDVAEEWSELVRPTMEDCIKLTVPILSEGAIADNWEDLK